MAKEISEKAQQDLYERTLRHGIELWDECLPKLEAYHEPSEDITRQPMMRFVNDALTETLLHQPQSAKMPVTASSQLGKVYDGLIGRTSVREKHLYIAQDFIGSDGYVHRSLILEHNDHRRLVGRLPYKAQVFLGERMLQGESNKSTSAAMCESFLTVDAEQFSVPLGNIDGLTVRERAQFVRRYERAHALLLSPAGKALTEAASVNYRLADGNNLQVDFYPARNSRSVYIIRQNDRAQLDKPAADWRMNFYSSVPPFGESGTMIMMSSERPGSKVMESYKSVAAYDEFLCFLENFADYANYGMDTSLARPIAGMDVSQTVEAALQPTTPVSFSVSDFVKRHDRD